MFTFKQTVWKPLGSLGVILLSFPAANPTLAELSPPEINSIARQTTVLIAPGLTPELVKELENNRNNPLARKNNPEGVWNPGSGVLIAKQQKTYYVLTVTHNFRQRHLDQGLSYGIRTSDGQVHEVKEINDGRACPLKESVAFNTLTRLGCYSIRIPGRVAGADLAVISFESEEEYPIASVGNVDEVQIPDRVYISGWPDPEKEFDSATGKCRGQVALRTRRLAWVPVTRKIEPVQGQNGYSVFYLDQTRPGMSGGPVFDSNGFLVGIHGRGSANTGKMMSQYCSVSDKQAFQSEDIDKDISEAVNYEPPILYTRFSSGQNLNYFFRLWQQIGVNLPFNQKPPSQKLIQAALINQDSTDVGRSKIWDISAQEDITGVFDDPDDLVEDIYNIFTFKLENQLRDQPSGGCGSILLGDEQERCRQ